MTALYHQDAIVDDYYALPVPELETATPIPLDRIRATDWYTFDGDSSIPYAIYDSDDLCVGQVPPTPEGFTPGEIAAEVERSGGMLHSLKAIFDGIDKLIKWIRQ